MKNAAIFNEKIKPPKTQKSSQPGTPLLRGFRVCFEGKKPYEPVRRTPGVKILVFTTAEIEGLSLLAACRDTPAEILPMIGQETASVLLDLGLIRVSRNKVSIRVTPEGHRLLQKAGRDFPSDGQYRCAGQILDRRLITARFLFWLKSCGVRHFLQKPTVTEGLSFLPSFMLRREKGRNVLGASRFIGLLYAEKTVFPCRKTVFSG